MCQHGAMLDLGEPCPDCGISFGPRDRQDGMTAYAHCPLCSSTCATPFFETDKRGWTVTILKCDWCGMEYQ